MVDVVRETAACRVSELVVPTTTRAVGVVSAGATEDGATSDGRVCCGASPDGEAGNAPSAAPVARFATVCGAIRAVAGARGGAVWPSDPEAAHSFPSAVPMPSRVAATPLAESVERAATGTLQHSVAAEDLAADPITGLLAQLRAATTVYVCRLRSDGARPEQMLVGVKALVREAMVADGWYDPEATQALLAHVVRWSIAAYYDR